MSILVLLLLALQLIKDESLQHAKMVYAKDIMHIHMQIKAANIYMAYIYMYARLG